MAPGRQRCGSKNTAGCRLIRMRFPILKFSRSSAISLGICVTALALFIALAWLAVRDRSATYDEPNDAIEAWTVTRLGDYRISPWDPPLAYYWAGLRQSRDCLRADFNARQWQSAPHDVGDELLFSTNTLYRTPGNDADVMRCR